MTTNFKSRTRCRLILASLLAFQCPTSLVSAANQAIAVEKRRVGESVSLGVPQALVALYQDYAEHYVDLWCGTPPQRQTLNVVTSSRESIGTTGFPCSACKTGCGMDNHIDGVFQETKSNTFQTLPCDDCGNGKCNSGGNECLTGTTYPNGNSWRGFEALDRCYVGGRHQEPVKKEKNENVTEGDDVDLDRAAAMAFDLSFTCQTQVTGTHTEEMADGVLSMHNAPGSFIHQMVDAGVISEHKFSLCLRKVMDPKTSGSHAGAMTLGGTDTRLHSSDMVLSLLDTRAAGYRVRMRKIHLRMNSDNDATISKGEVQSVDLQEEDLNEHPILLDSAYRDTFLTASISTTLFSAWRKMTGASYSSYAKAMSAGERDALPTILFQLVGDEDFNGAILASKNTSMASDIIGLAGDLDPDHPFDVIVEMPASHYLELEPGEDERYTRTISTSTKSETGSVLGANFMRGHDVLFNIDDQRLGWARSLCDYTDLLEEYYHGNVPKESSSAGNGPNLCSSWFCRGTLLLVIFAGVGGAALICLPRLSRRERSVYHTHQVEVELTEAELQQREELVFSFD